MADKWIDEVLTFWFDEVGPEKWFKSGPELDEEIRRRFSKLHARLASAPLTGAMASARGSLAAVILFDQLPRNMYRGTAAAFATDDLAKYIARKALEKKFDEQLSPSERQFLYLPFQHSEIMADQERSVMLYKELGEAEPLRYAIEHRDIVERFGRFPHRNRALGRDTTPDENTFLMEHTGYGQ